MLYAENPGMEELDALADEGLSIAVRLGRRLSCLEGIPGSHKWLLDDDRVACLDLIYHGEARITGVAPGRCKVSCLFRTKITGAEMRSEITVRIVRRTEIQN